MITDLESFIAEQKAKLSQEKQEFRREPQTSAIHANGEERSFTTDEPSRRVPLEKRLQQRRLEMEDRQMNNQHMMTEMAGKDDRQQNHYLKAPTPEAGIVTKLGSYDRTRLKLREERRDEYNKYLAEQNGRRGVRLKSGAPSDGPLEPDTAGNSLPGLRNHPSAELRKMVERNREYNEMLRKQMDQQKSPRSTRKGYESPVISYDEILQKKRDEETKYRRYNDPGFYDHRTNLGDQSYNRLSVSEGSLRKNRNEEDPGMRNQEQDFDSRKVRFAGRISSDPVDYPNSDRVYHLNPDNEHYNATLLIGERLNNDVERKSAYRDELQKQIAEKKSLREREKLELRGVSGGISSSKGAEMRPSSWSANEGVSARLTKSNTPRPVQSSLLGEQRPQLYKIDGILANGFEFNRCQPRYYHPLSGASDHPHGTRSLLPQNNQINDAYFYYGNIDPTMADATSSVQPLPQTKPALRASSYVLSNGAETQPGYSYNNSLERPSIGGPGAYNNEAERKRADEEKKRQYQLELQAQISETKQKKEWEKQEKEKYDRKMEQEFASYNPFGRGGGGAPVKDAHGSVITSRNLESLITHQPRPVGFADPQNTARNEVQYNSPQSTNAARSGENFARGGNGIFGEPLSEEKKNSRLKYQEELRIQIEEKNLRLEKEKEKMKQEDDRIEQKIREDAAREAQELEENNKKEQEKKERFKQDQLALKRAVEDRMHEEEKQKRAQNDADRRKLVQDEERQQQMKSPRLESPPITSAFISHQKDPQKLTKSPPLPARRTQSRQSQVSNSEALENLANMGKKLQIERKNIEKTFQQMQSEPEIFDPRLVLRPQNRKQPYASVFELAKTGRPISVHRMPTKDVSHPRSSELRDHRLHQPFSETDADAIEMDRKQRATLIAQQKELDRLNKENFFDYENIQQPSNESYQPSAKQLHSTTDYLPFVGSDREDGSHIFSDDLKQRNNQNQRRPRDYPKRDDILRRQVSITSLDPDELRDKNNERLRKLKALTGDDISNGDHEAVLEKFLSRHTRRRPPSRDPLNDNSWLLPSTAH